MSPKTRGKSKESEGELTKGEERKAGREREMGRMHGTTMNEGVLGETWRKSERMEGRGKEKRGEMGTD